MGLSVYPLYCTINPCIPSSWEHSLIKYRRGERTFEIEIANPERVQSGIANIEIDGKQVTDGRIPFEDPSYRNVVHIKVLLGGATPTYQA
jgi:cellobiose phosphorylase